MRVAIVGGGITGLAAAHRLLELAPSVEVELFEATSRVGGVLQTDQVAGCLVERSADMFTTKEPAAKDLCHRLGLDTALIGTRQEYQRAFIAQADRLVPIPDGLNLMSPSNLDSIRTTPLLSVAGKKRFLEEVDVPPRENLGDESLRSFAVRRFGLEAYEKIFQPLVGGIYTADPTKLSLQATLPQYLEMEAKFGSVIGALQAKASQSGECGAVPGRPGTKVTSGARYNLFVAPADGLQTLIQTLADRIVNTEVHFESPIQRLEPLDSGWKITTKNRESHFDGVLIAVPGHVAGHLLSGVNGRLGELLNGIECASSAIVVQGWMRQQIQHALDGFGFVVPLTENRTILAGSFSSVKFPGRSPTDQVLIRSFVGGACQGHLLAATDQELGRRVREDLFDLLGAKGRPRFETVIRWNESMPQYHVGHEERIDEIGQAISELPHLEIAGKSYTGVGIPACVQSGENAGEKLIRDLGVS